MLALKTKDSDESENVEMEAVESCNTEDVLA